MKEKVLLITGQPGIGKTTLADILLFEKAKNDFHIYQVVNVSEAEDDINENEEQKQVFYFDDFLGANYSEIVNSHKTETQLTAFVERVKNTPNKYLILTTRTIILNQAVERYEKISQSGLNRKQFEIVLGDYTKYEKALILYNHLYFKKINPAFFNQIVQGNFYRSIVNHRNYTPRIIDFITDENRLSDVSALEYPAFITDNLNNPKDIWRYSFLRQIEYPERCSLLTLFTFETSVSETALNKAFQKRMRYERDENNRVLSPGQFDDSIKLLLNGFITVSLTSTNPPKRQFQFINPSLADFLIGYLNESSNELTQVIASLVFLDQLYRFNPAKNVLPLNTSHQLLIRDLVSEDSLTVRSKVNSNMTANEKNIQFLDTLCRYSPEIIKDDELLGILTKIDLTASFVKISSQLLYILTNLGAAPKTKTFVKINFEIIIHNLIISTDDYDDAKKIPELFEIFEENYEDYSESDEGFDNLINMMSSVLSRYEEGSISDLKSNIHEMDAAEALYDELSDIEYILKKQLFPGLLFDYDFDIRLDEDYWKEVISDNNRRADHESDKMDDYYEIYRENQYSAQNEDRAIDDLFR